MKRSQEYELRKKCGDLNALCGIRDYVFNDGPARGVRAFELNNGRGVEMTVLADRGLDIPYLSYKGHNIGLLNKVGVRSPYLYREDGAAGFLKQFYAGLLTTGGLSYAGAPCEEDGRLLGLHGPYDNLPASQARAYSDYDGDDKVLVVRGEEINAWLRRNMDALHADCRRVIDADTSEVPEGLEIPPMSTGRKIALRVVGALMQPFRNIV